MSIYKNDSLSEVPIYGSSRLGEYKPLSPGEGAGGEAEGSHTFGLRRYELTNHLGNVLTVISDKVGMKADSVWATVLNASDYYPFGLEMKGRTWTDSTYRYGFNGKETDIETGYTDYGFRLMDRAAGRFLTPDPLTKKYPELTPYQFASNSPIESVDLDGQESFSSKNNPSLIYNGPVSSEFIQSNNLTRTDQLHSSSLPEPQHTLVTSYSSGMGLPGLQASIVRLNYAAKTFQLKSLYSSAMAGNLDDGIRGSSLRNQYVLGARKFTPEPYLSFAEDLKGSNNLKINPSGRFYKTNLSVNLKMGVVGGASIAGLGYGVYSSYKAIDESGYSPSVMAEEGGTWAGALYGGAQGGAAFSTLGPWGTLGGSIGGSLVGGLLGKGAVQTIIGSSAPSYKPDKDPRIIEQDATKFAKPAIPVTKE